MSDSGDNNPLGRRGFFGDALRDMMNPLSSLLERKVNPLLNVVNSIPAEVEKLINGPSDQPHVAHTQEAAKPAFNVAGDRLLRPPGALGGGGAEFESACSRCGKCVDVCPANAIKLDVNTRIGGGMPYIVPADRPCVVCEELACMKLCPSGALRLVDKLSIRIGVAKVDHASCLRSRGEECKLCVDACPVREQAIHIGESGRIRVKKNGCIGCGMCENVCPTEPRSIIVRRDGRVDVIIA